MNQITINYFKDYQKELEEKPNTDHLLIDFDSIKNLICITEEEDPIKEMCDYFMTIVEFVDPNVSVYVVNNGTVPFAKMHRERQNNYKKMYDVKNISKIYEKYAQENNHETIWNTNNVNPGTPFSKKLSRSILRAMIEIKKKLPDIKMVLDGYSRPGDAHNKISQKIKHLDLKYNDNVTIFSADDNFILYVVRYIDKNVNLLTEGFTYIDYSRIFDSIIEKFELGNYDKRFVSRDIIVVSMFCGNQFLEPLGFILDQKTNGFDILLNVYRRVLVKQTGYLVTPEKEFNYDFLMDFLTECGSQEDQYYKKRYARRIEYLPDLDEQDIEFSNELTLEESIQRYYDLEFYHPEHELYHVFHREINRINYMDEHHEWKMQYYSYFFRAHTDNRDKYNALRTDICFKYLKTAVYSLKYYLDNHVSWRWYYPYRVAPLPSDLRISMEIFRNLNTIEKLYQFNKGFPFKPLEQMMMTVPPGKPNEVLPKPLRELMRDDELKVYYPEFFRIDIVNGIRTRDTIPLLPNININKVIKKIKEVYRLLSREYKLLNKFNYATLST